MYCSEHPYMLLKDTDPILDQATGNENWLNGMFVSHLSNVKNLYFSLHTSILLYYSKCLTNREDSFLLDWIVVT